jgi:Chaperone of endosialidase
MKSISYFAGVACLALTLGSAGVQAQNVGIGFTSPASKLSVNGNFSVGYNLVAPTNGALIQGFTCIGTTAPDPGAAGANDPYLTVASDGNANITLSPATGGASIRAGIFFGDNTYLECTDSTTNGNKDLTFFNVATQANVLTLSEGNPSQHLPGFVGIINPTPVVPLDVRGSAPSVDVGGGTENNFYWGSGGVLNNGSLASGTYPTVSAYFAGNVIGGNQIMSYNGTLTASDARLKNIIGKSDAAKDLKTLEKIEVTDYTMKDIVKFGQEPFKKVVAQQVEKVYPTAVKTVGFKGLTYTPDIFVPSSKVEKGKEGTAITINKAHGLRVGDSVRLVTTKNQEVDFDVTKVVDANTFVIKDNAAIRLGDKVFVYGKFCPDLKAVDYEALSTLNISATQELAKKVEALENENFELRTHSDRLSQKEQEQDNEIAELKATNQKLSAMDTDLEALKKLVATMHSKDDAGVHPVALSQ